jgi:hypothetical protein
MQMERATGRAVPDVVSPSSVRLFVVCAISTLAYTLDLEPVVNPGT